jgi:carbonic anhydrase
MSSTINISSQNIAGDCNLKCAYSYDYHNSSTTARNEGFSISLSYDKANISPVIYNTNKYEVASIIIYSPSVHLFNGTQTNAEIIISHRPVISGPPLWVGIPIIASSDSTSASTLLTQIITAISTNAPAQGESTNLNISNFNLNNFIPAKKPLYSYSQGPINWIVFGKENAIGLSQDSLNTLAKVIKPLTGVQAPAGPLVFYNASGATKGLSGSGDQIYIDCQPVTTSDEQIDVTTSKSPVTFDLNNPTTLLILQILISCILFFLLLFGIHYGLKYISNVNIALPKMGKTS